MPQNKPDYIPAIRFNWLTPLYDPIVRLLMPEAAFKRRLVEQMKVKSGNRILDIGCGTATLTIFIKMAHPDAEVIGLDGDPRILDLARSKISREGLDITLDEGMSFNLPYPDGSFDRVVSSLMIHHLTRENKIRTFNEIFRVLKPGGEFHAADFGKPQNVFMYLLSLIFRLFEETSENIKGLLPEMFRNAGFKEAEETARYMTIVGTLSLYKARKPG